MVTMMKNVQISQELFVALLHYHLSGENEYEEVIEQGLEQKLDAMLRHELYAQYKTAPTEPISNVTFEPGCRNNWHIHKATKGGGQILVCVGGRGYYQEWGKEPVELFPGDAVYISAGVKHWHGAAPDSWFSHLAIEAPGENKSNEWLEPVSEEEYSGVVRHQR